MTPAQRLALALAILGGGSAVVGGVVVATAVGPGEHAVVCLAQEGVDGGVVQADTDVCTLTLTPTTEACALLLEAGGDNLTAYPADVPAAELGRMLMTLQHEGAILSWHSTATDAGCTTAVWMTREQAREFSSLPGQSGGGSLFVVAPAAVDAGTLPQVAGASGVPDSFILSASP